MKRSEFRGFTLIELLVVIAIIAILAAILFPVFAQAREKARQTTCLSNEKQFALGILMYVQDYDETYPGGQMYGNEDCSWTTEVQPYIKNGTQQSTAFGAGYGGGVYSCPSGKLSDYQAYELRSDLFPNFWSGSPFIAETTASVDSPSTHIMGQEVGEQAVNDGVEFMFVTHVWFWASQNIDWNNIENTKVPDVANSRDCDEKGPGINWNWQRCSQFPRYRHSGTSNFPFLDGHCKAIPKGQLDYGHNVYNAKTDSNSFG